MDQTTDCPISLRLWNTDHNSWHSYGWENTRHH